MAALDRYGINYLIVGGIAVGFHSEPRFTKDLDVLVAIRPPEQHLLLQALKDFGAPTHLVTPADFTNEDFVFHFGTPPWRIDILTSIPGVDFDLAFADLPGAAAKNKRFRVGTDFAGRGTNSRSNGRIRRATAAGRLKTTRG